MSAVQAILNNFKSGNENKLSQSETNSFAPESIFSMLAYELQNTYNKYLIGTHLSPATNFNPTLSKEAHVFARKFTKTMDTSEISLENFGAAKYYLNGFFYEVTEMGSLIYSYKEEHLVTPSEAGEILGVERQTIHKYTHLGLETVDTTKHNKIPKDALIQWKNPVWATHLQGIGQKFKARDQSLNQYLNELLEQLEQVKAGYEQPLEDVFKEIINGEIDAADSIHFFAYNNWKNVLEEITFVKGKLSGEDQ